MRICPKRDAVCPHGMDCPFTTDQYECRDGRSDIRSRLEECQLSMATRGQLDGSLSPHLWEQLRQRLQKIYRKATGEPMAVLSVDDASPSPISADAVVEACAADWQAALFALSEWEPNRKPDELEEMLSDVIRALKGTFPAVDGWRTMDSAPKDGTPFVAINIRHLTGHHITIYKWDGPPNYWHAKQQGTCIRPDYQDDYRWIPLPAAPSTQEADHDNG